MSRISDYLYTQQNAMTRTLEQAVMLESPTDERHAVNTVADFFAQEFQGLGANVERLPEEAFGDHLRITWGDGDVEPVAANPASTTHVYTGADTHTISATATDEDGTFDANQIQVTVIYPFVADRHIFYNNSILDGGDPAANAADDAAIATDKEALLSG